MKTKHHRKGDITSVILKRIKKRLPSIVLQEKVTTLSHISKQFIHRDTVYLKTDYEKFLL